MSDEAKRVALVTGASRGIGAAIAARLADDGFHVVGTATSDAGAGRIGEALAGRGEGAVLQVTDPASVKALFEHMAGSCGAPAVLVNNAGITRDNLMLRMKEDEWDDVVATNLTALYSLSKAALRPMTRARWGRIINISSVVGRMGNPGQANYAASKAGMEGFSRALALEVGSRGITVNAVAPGFIETDMTDAIPEEQRDALLSRVALGRLGAATEVAAVVAFLASDGAAYISGETIAVNGGLYMG